MSDIDFSGPSDERIERLEQKVAEIEALIKGLTDEMLDIKALQKNQRSAPVIQAVTPPAPSRNKTTKLEETKQSNSTQVDSKQEKISWKIQPDGTLARVQDTSEEIIIASAYDIRLKGKNGVEQNKNNLIIVEDIEDDEKK